jgi:hypothetical protein
MFVFALALNREQAPLNASALLKPKNIIIVVMLLFGETGCITGTVFGKLNGFCCSA